MRKEKEFIRTPFTAPFHFIDRLLFECVTVSLVCDIALSN